MSGPDENEVHGAPPPQASTGNPRAELHARSGADSSPRPAPSALAAAAGGASFRERESATYAELTRLDPRLAALFLSGHQIVTRVHTDPGAVYLLAHVGRELSRGVIRALLGDEAPPREEGEELLENEGNRRTIGAVLGQPYMHASVTAWFRLNETFVRSCHLNVNANAPDATRVADAFVAFSDLLYGRVAPYFTTATELDALLAVAAPTPDDITRAEALLTRVQQRRYFFSKLEHASWVVPLAARGHFANPPERVVHADGSWQMRGWPEGEYLVRMAPHEPKAVAEHLMKVPNTLFNPVVWGVITNASMALPVDLAGSLASRVAKALATVPGDFLSHDAVDLVKRLAVEGHSSAWKLAEALLRCRPEAEGVVLARAFGTGITDHERLANAAFSRLELYELSRFCEEALPALQQLDLGRALKLMAGRLDHLMRFVRAGVGDAAADVRSSQWWCESLDDSGREGVRREIALVTPRMATALSEMGPASAQLAWAQLQSRTGEIFERIRLWVLTRAGENLPAELDAAIAGDALLDPPYGAREAAALLRAQFGNASAEARTLFRYALERGPSADEVRSLIAYRRQFSPSSVNSAELSPEEAGVETAPHHELAEREAEPRAQLRTRREIEAAVHNWQAQRLRWFHDRIPEELSALANSVGLVAQVPSVEQQALDEVGYHSASITWSGPVSPRSAGKLASMEPHAIVTFLAEWTPGDGGSDAFSYRGLEDALTAYAGTHPSAAAHVLSSVATLSLRPGYVSGLLSGMRAAAAEGRDVPWTDVLGAAADVVCAADRALHSANDGQNAEPVDRHASRSLNAEKAAWAHVIRAVAELVQAGCSYNRLATESSPQVWSIMGALVQSPALRADWPTVSETVGFEGALIDGLVMATRETARALVTSGHWEYRTDQRSEGDAAQEERHAPQVEALIAPLLSELLERGSEATREVETIMGQFAPQLMLLAPNWFAASEERLFAGGAEDAIKHPAWGDYLLRAGVYDRCFTQLRRWYVLATKAVQDGTASQEGGKEHSQSRDEWSISRGLASHVLTAVVRGLAEIGDSDSLVETTFTSVSAQERARVYWEVFRGWSDTAEAPPDIYAKRLLRFWEWRLEALEALAPSPARDTEAAGLIWLLKTPHLPSADVIRLGRRTLQLCSISERLSAGAWARLRTLAQDDAAETFELAEMLIERALARPYAHLPFNEVAPVLRASLKSTDDSVRVRAERLIHRLGEVAGRHEYGQLLRGGEAAADSTEEPSNL